MKQRTNTLARTLALAVWLTTVLGCASTPQRIQYNTISAATDGVQTAMRGFNLKYQEGKATEADRDKALAIYAEFQKVALKAAGNLLVPRAPTAGDIAEVSKAAVDAIFAIKKITGGAE